jgi:asparagine synthase (glutamine-hydrolysing)
MSILAGIYSRRPGAQIESVKKAILRQMRGGPVATDEVTTLYSDDCLFICKRDFGCYGESAWLENEHGLTTLIGAPLLSSSRRDDCAALSHDVNWTQRLLDAQGCFSVARYDKLRTSLELAVDSLALRPFYLMELADGVLFSTQLKLLKNLGLGLEIDLDSLYEMALLGYPLQDRSAYQGVRTSGPGELLTIDHMGVSVERYHDWKRQPCGSQSEAEGLDALDTAFRQAVSLAAADDRHHVSTLSGGLDSRLIACELSRRDLSLECLNFSVGRSQDQYCAARFAETVPLVLHSVAVEDTQALSVERRLGDCWSPQRFDHYRRVERPRMLWSGNGGSVCIGMVYTNPDIVEACLHNDAEQLIDAYLKQQYAYLPRHIIMSADHYQQRLKANLLQSMESYRGLPMLKAWQLFLWEHDQHHHLAAPYENIDLYRLEFHLPFFAKSVLEAMFAMPAEAALFHRLYMKWLNKSYPQAVQSPWQAYPGHEACPIPISMTSQWDLGTPAATRRRLLRNSWQSVLRGDSRIFKRHMLAVSCLAEVLGLRDVTHQLRLVTKLNHWLTAEPLS